MGGTAVVLLGCGGPKHPAFQDLTGANGGGRATGGASTVDTPDDLGGATGTDTPDAPDMTPSPGTGPFDSSQAYVLGPLNGVDGKYAVAPATNPVLYSYGFETRIRGTAALRGGELYYQNDDNTPVRIFLPDVVDHRAPAELPGAGAQANDAVVSTPKCVGDVAKNDGPFTFLVGATGQLIYECYYGGNWYEGDVSVYDVQPDRTLLYLGTTNRGLAYRSISDRFYIVTLRTNTEVVVSDEVKAPFFAVHSAGTGFHVVTSGDTGADLWNVNAAGGATKLGTYQLDSGFGTLSAALTAADELVLLGFSDATGQVIKRYYTTTTTSDTLYTQDDSSFLDTDQSKLITGP